MFPLIPILSGAALVSGALLVRFHQKQTGCRRMLMEKLLTQPSFPPSPPHILPVTLQQSLQDLQGQITEATNAITTYCTRVDDRYQAFVQRWVDPLLIGRQHLQHLQELESMNLRELSPFEKYANRTFPVALANMVLLSLARWLSFPLHPLIDLMVLYVVYPSYQLAWYSAVRERRLHIFQFGAIYITGMWIGGYYWTGAISTIFFNLCQKAMSMVENQGRYRLVNVFSQQPRTVWVLVDGLEVETPFAQLHTGNTIALNAGQVVPCDGVVIDGAALIDQHMLTGESQPVEKTIGDSVLAATLVIAGKIYLRVEKTGAETTAAQIGEILNRTGTYRMSIQSQAFERANQLMMPTLALSTVAWLLAGPFAATAIFGCNLTASIIGLAPLTMLNFLNRLARQTVLVKDGRALEQLPAIDTIVFDKTGTLTLERPHVIQIHTCHTLHAEEVLRLAAAAEHRQSHPIAQAILAEAATRPLSLPTIEDAHYEVGYGLKVRIEEQTVQVGSARYLAQEGIELSTSLQTLQNDCHAQGHSLVFVSVDGRAVGAIELKPTLRPEVQPLVTGLRQRNIQLYIISGDQDAPTRQLADSLSMDGYFANVLPTGKAELVTQLQQKGHKVCFIGDGINDAIALKQADVSISLRGATTAATDTAEVVLMDGSLQQLLPLLNEADHFNRDIRIILNTAIGLSLLSTGGVLFAHFTFATVQFLSMLNFSVGLGVANKSWLRLQD